jgi:succinoglycan biosynthesis protein ExoO
MTSQATAKTGTGESIGRKPNVLFISRQRLVGATNGSSAYLIDLARAVRKADMIPHLLQPSPSLAGRWPILSMAPEMAVFATHRIRGLFRIGRHFIVPSPRILASVARAALAAAARRLGARGAWAADRPAPYAIALPWTDLDHRFVALHAPPCVDVVLADYVFCAEGFADLAASLPSAIVMHDLFHLRDGGTRDSVAALDRDEELRLLMRADAIVAIQAEEADFVARHVPTAKAILAPIAVGAVPAAQPGDADRLLFVGSNTAPNVVGLQWFLAEVWPQLRAVRPQITLDVAGSVNRAFAGAKPDGVCFHGRVVDLGPLYARAGVVISPLTFGSGLKIKLVEALAHGKAVIATAVTLQGVVDICAGAVLCADDAADFTASILLLCADTGARQELAAAALEVARNHFSTVVCHAPFTDWLKSVVMTSRN